MDINNNLRQAETERIIATVERYFADKFDGAYVYQATSGAEYCTLYVALPHRAKVECDQAEYELSALFDRQTVLVRPIDMYEADLQVEVDYPDKKLYTFAEMLPALTVAKEQANGQPLIAVGRDGKGSLVCPKLNEVVHMAVCGIASRGSDLYVQSLLASIVATNSPDEVRLMIVDTRAAMYKDFNGVPHMLFDNVATDDMQAEAQMKWLVEEMDRRYKMFAEAHCLRISEYNQAAAETGATAMYRIVAVVDDIAEVSKEVQKRVMMLSTKARAVGICLVVKADNPDWFRNCSVMLTNLPTRLVVQTANGQHSQRLLGWRGAEKLRNIGDAYYKSIRYSDGIRVQVAVATQKEVQQVCMSAKNKYVCASHSLNNDKIAVNSTVIKSECVFGEMKKFLEFGTKIDDIRYVYEKTKQYGTVLTYTNDANAFIVFDPPKLCIVGESILGKMVLYKADSDLDGEFVFLFEFAKKQGKWGHFHPICCEKAVNAIVDWMNGAWNS